LKSAFQGAARRASAFADAKGIFRSAQADRRPKAFAPIEIGLFGRYAPGVGLRRRKGDFSVGAGRPWAGGSAPIEIGLQRRCAPGVGLRRRKGDFRSAQADRGPKALRRLWAGGVFAPIEIGLSNRPFGALRAGVAFDAFAEALRD